LAQAMGKGAAGIQIDSDEYFKEFVLLILKQNKHYLNNPEQQPLKFRQWITLFKKVEGGFLYVKDLAHY
jgi:hypothetical protein